ncbi:phosphoribose diphosphate:decaprenyl-phosphate phosphoribosyltransferase [Mycobacterium tuberculosis CCDC5079]|nr:phosphoribose diphosphate:decaprenyl-phosphate phosphoribosyltransferase [Mycobacterium tuberculosis CCDC5079]
MSEDVVTQPPANLVAGVVKAIRPRQWVKNVLVLAAPLAALGGGVRYDYVEVLSKVSMAFVVFSLAASAVYLVNDVRDVEADREHPTKRFRPIAAGVVPEWLAYTVAVVLGVTSLAGAWMLTPNLALVMVVYLAMQLAYCFGLKHQAVVEICVVSSAYLIRAIAGGRGHQNPAVQVVFADHGIRFAVHGGRQALRRAASGRTHRRCDPQVAGKLHQHLSAVRLDVVGHRGGLVLRAVGFRARRLQRVLVRGVDDSVHHRDPALRGGRRWRPGRGAGRYRAA